jgi:DNA-binding response OmpR family regulator
MALCERCLAVMHQPLDWPPEVDPDYRVIRFPALDKPIDMISLDILGVLWQRRGRPVTSETLNRLVWGANPTSDPAVRVYVSKLRRKLDGLYSISNAYGGSYALHPEGR